MAPTNMKATLKRNDQPVVADAVTVPTGRIEPGGDEHENPFRAAHAKPHWAELIRLAGDRAAILFQELRRHMRRIDGLQEELHYFGPEWGWAPRYRVGEGILFTAHILPGRLEATVSLEGPLKETLLASPRIAARLKDGIRSAGFSGSGAELRVWLSNRAAVRSFAQLVAFKNKIAASRRA